MWRPSQIVTDEKRNGEHPRTFCLSQKLRAHCADPSNPIGKQRAEFLPGKEAKETALTLQGDKKHSKRIDGTDKPSMLSMRRSKTQKDQMAAQGALDRPGMKHVHPRNGNASIFTIWPADLSKQSQCGFYLRRTIGLGETLMLTLSGEDLNA